MAFFEQPDVKDALTALAAEPELTVLVGAGASKEVGLPTWSELVDALAHRAVGSKRSWSAFADELRHQISDGDLLAAAERVEVVLGQLVCARRSNGSCTAMTTLPTSSLGRSPRE